MYRLVILQPDFSTQIYYICITIINFTIKKVGKYLVHIVNRVLSNLDCTDRGILNLQNIQL
jgi:hypothetical protein